MSNVGSLVSLDLSEVFTAGDNSSNRIMFANAMDYVSKALNIDSQEPVLVFNLEVEVPIVGSLAYTHLVLASSFFYTFDSLWSIISVLSNNESDASKIGYFDVIHFMETLYQHMPFLHTSMTSSRDAFVRGVYPMYNPHAEAITSLCAEQCSLLSMYGLSFPAANSRCFDLDGIDVSKLGINVVIDSMSMMYRDLVGNALSLSRMLRSTIFSVKGVTKMLTLRNAAIVLGDSQGYVPYMLLNRLGRLRIFSDENVRLDLLSSLAKKLARRLSLNIPIGGDDGAYHHIVVDTLKNVYAITMRDANTDSNVNNEDVCCEVDGGVSNEAKVPEKVGT
ncbi:MAG: hypothetical protein QXU32_06880 [Nitrososphaerales archaeon]